jgi:hypothetical protein
MLGYFNKSIDENTLTRFEKLILSEAFMKLKLNNDINNNHVNHKSISDKLALGHYLYEMCTDIHKDTDIR